ncbi:hypothetical protein MJ1HA_0854 [Metallosphaera sedula]|nr:hypothetical protein MJ1HA_0854 [Metallosphaera sedula]
MYNFASRLMILVNDTLLLMMLAEFLLLLVLPLITLSSLWLRYYRKIMLEALSFPGTSYTENSVHLMPSQSITFKVDGKCVLVVNGVSSWVTMRVNGGPPQRIFKVRLLNTKGIVEVKNESKVFQVSLLVRCES